MIFEGNRDFTLLEISNATTSTASKKKVKISGGEEGTNLISTGDFYTAPKVDVETITNLREDIYIAGVVKKQKNLIFNEKYTIEVEDVKTRKVDEELSNTMMDMCESKSVRLWANMSWSYDCLFHWGIATFNPVWGVDKESGLKDIRLLKLRRLPPETFKTKPPGSQLIYSPILQGIVPDKEGELTFYQEPAAGPPELIKNVFYVKNPADWGFAGNPIIIPCVSILGMLGFTWNTVMEQVNRIGAKILFMKVNNPQGASTRNGNVSDLDYANAILKNWGKDTGFVIRDNFDPIDLKLSDDSNSLEVIDKLNDLISEYVNPASFIASKQETRLGGNDNAKLEMHDNYIKGWHSILSEQVEMLLNRYLEYNQFEGYRVHIKIPPPSHSTRDEDRKDAEAGFLTQSLDQNELRKLLRHPAKTDEEIKKLIEYYAGVSRTEQLIKV
jgi:hypothetical protein